MSTEQPIPLLCSLRTLIANDSWAASFQTMGQYRIALLKVMENVPTLNRAAVDVVAERRRQVAEEQWDTAHDDAHREGDLARAAAAYVLQDVGVPALIPCIAALDGQPLWPWHPTWWKPRDRRRNLLRAAALLLAEIERLDRRTEAAIAG